MTILIAQSVYYLRTTMSCIVTGVLELTIGFFWNKLRDHTANKLKEGDLTDEKCRQLIVRELDEVKDMLHDISRKDLLSSISFLKEGVQLLNFSLDESTDEESGTSDVKERPRDVEYAAGTILRLLKSQRKHHEDSHFEEEAGREISRVIGNLDIISKERFISAKSLFGDARKEATRAFNNRTLNTEDRILACKLRMISRILESLEDLNAAANVCKLYLEELHEMDTIREMFSVHLSGGIKSLFKKKKRLEMVTSVIMINYMLCNFMINYAKKELDLCGWTRLQLSQRNLHPLVDVETQTIMRKSGVRAPNRFVFSDLICPVTANPNNPRTSILDEIMAKDEDHGNSVEVLINERRELHFSFSRETIEFSPNKQANVLHAITTDDENNIYTVVYFKPTPNTVHFKLCVADAKGNMTKSTSLEFLSLTENNQFQESSQLATDQSEVPTGPFGPNSVELVISKDKNVLVLGHQSRIYVCDTCGQLKHSFETCDRNELVSISDKNEIISAKYRGRKFYFYTEKGELILESKVVIRGQDIYDLVFHHISKKVYILTRNSETLSQLLESYSCSGEPLQTLPLYLPLDFRALQVLPEGPVAVIHEKGFILT